MDKKIKHRMLGVLVVAALVVILSPFFQGKNEFSTDTPSVKAPPFPGQGSQMSATDSIAETTAAVIQTPIPVVANTASSEVRDKPDDTITNMHVNNIPAVNQPDSSSPEADLESSLKDAMTENKPRQHDDRTRINKTVTQARVPPHAQTPGLALIPALTGGDNGLIVLKSSVWVIQMGSYKNKSKALHLVNQLRANGYPAFIQKISSTFGESTQVYVGPTAKRNAASDLADRLETDMHIHGIIISYKPLTL